MAKNRSMAIKHAIAKKWAIQEVLENAKAEMCCKTIPKNYKIYNHNQSSLFFSKYAIQRRIDALVGRHCPIEEFAKKCNDVYEYLITHTVPETREHYKDFRMEE